MHFEAANYEALNFWLHAAELAGIVLLGLMQWAGNRHRATKESIARVEKKGEDHVTGLAVNVRREMAKIDSRLDEHHSRIIKVEERVPSDDKWKALYDRLGAVERGMTGLSAKLEGTEKLLNILHRDRLRDTE